MAAAPSEARREAVAALLKTGQDRARASLGKLRAVAVASAPARQALGRARQRVAVDRGDREQLDVHAAFLALVVTDDRRAQQAGGLQLAQPAAQA